MHPCHGETWGAEPLFAQGFQGFKAETPGSTPSPMPAVVLCFHESRVHAMNLGTRWGELQTTYEAKPHLMGQKPFQGQQRSRQQREQAEHLLPPLPATGRLCFQMHRLSYYRLVSSKKRPCSLPTRAKHGQAVLVLVAHPAPAILGTPAQVLQHHPAPMPEMPPLPPIP